MAEEEGFEPPVPCGTTVFKTAALDHSATPPLKVGLADQILYADIHYKMADRNVKSNESGCFNR